MFSTFLNMLLFIYFHKLFFSYLFQRFCYVVMDILSAICKSDISFNIEEVLYKLCSELTQSIAKKDDNIENIIEKIKVISSFVNFIGDKDFLKTECSLTDQNIASLIETLMKLYFYSHNEELVFGSFNLSLLLMQSSIVSMSCQTHYEKLFVEQFSSFLLGNIFDDNDGNNSIVSKKLNLLVHHGINFSENLTIKLLDMLVHEVYFQDKSSKQFYVCLSLLEKFLMNLDLSESLEKIVADILISMSKFFDSNMKCVWDCFQSDAYDDTALSVNKHQLLTEKLEFGISVLHLLFNFACNKSIELISDNVDYILFEKSTWVTFLISGYHRKSNVRKAFCRAFSHAINHIKKKKIKLTISLSQDLSLSPYLFGKDDVAIWDSFAYVDYLLKFVQISELLEENQTHVVLPVLKKVKEFILNSSFTFWGFSIFFRMLSHENK